MDPVIEKKNFG